MTTEVFEQQSLLRSDPPDLATNPADRPDNPKDEDFQVLVGERKGKVGGRLTGRRRNHPRAVAAAEWLDGHIEVQKLVHGSPFRFPLPGAARSWTP
jgi:hypothetical protein